MTDHARLDPAVPPPLVDLDALAGQSPATTPAVIDVVGRVVARPDEVPNCTCGNVTVYGHGGRTALGALVFPCSRVLAIRARVDAVKAREGRRFGRWAR